MNVMFLLIMMTMVRASSDDSEEEDEEEKEKEEEPSEPVSYKDAQVWRTDLVNRTTMKEFVKLYKNQDISIWNVDTSRIDYLVREEKFPKILDMLRDLKLKHKVLLYNVQRQIERTSSKSVLWTEYSLRLGHRLDFKSYPPPEVLDEYYTFIKENYDSICHVRSAGHTIQNRTIPLLRVSNGNPSNKAILIIGGQHAREWIGISSVLFVAHNIVTKFDRLPSYMQNKNWYIVPVANPDGYAYTHATDRLWRKNKRTYKDKECKGVDLNRNYATAWDIPGVTEHNLCQEDYAGAAPFSEPESKALRNLYDELQDSLKAFLDVHAYGQLILYPRFYNTTPSDKLDVLRSTAIEMKKIMKQSTGEDYVYGTSGELLYHLSGAAVDWFHDNGISLSFAIESRDTGKEGFLVKPDKMEDAGKELLGAVLQIAKSVEPASKPRSHTKWL